MIGKKEFEELIKEHSEQNARIDLLCKVFSTSYGDPIIDWGFLMFRKVLEYTFDKIGLDWIDYYLYDNPSKRYFSDEKEFPLETLDDLWELIKDHRK